MNRDDGLGTMRRRTARGVLAFGACVQLSLLLGLPLLRTMTATEWVSFCSLASLFLISVGGAVFLTRYPRVSVAVVGCGALICCYWYVGLALQIRAQALALSGYFDIVNFWSFVLAMVANVILPVAFLLVWPLWRR